MIKVFYLPLSGINVLNSKKLTTLMHFRNTYTYTSKYNYEPALKGLHLWPSLVEKTKDFVYKSSIMKSVMCLQRMHFISFRCRPLCHTVSSAAVRSKKRTPQTILSMYAFSMFRVKVTTWSTVDGPCLKPACSVGRVGSRKGLMLPRIILSSSLKVVHSKEINFSHRGTSPHFRITFVYKADIKECH